MRVATWNLKQAVSPRKPPADLWSWAAENVRPDCIVLTEAKVPKAGVPHGWSAHWDPSGMYPDKPNGKWGTVVASRGMELLPVSTVGPRWRRSTLEFTWPAAVQVADVSRNGDHWATVVGFYAVTKNRRGEPSGSGRYSWPTMMRQLAPVFSSARKERVILAGDLNLLPSDLGDHAKQVGLIDLIEHTADTRPRIQKCASCRNPEGCHHMWTHKNGHSENAKVQQIDFIFATKQLVRELKHVGGGLADFPGVWEWSDHAPVFADFD